MPTNTLKEPSQVTYLVHEPGNGVRYEVTGVLLFAGPHSGMWLVAFPFFGSSYVFEPGAMVSVVYVAEKMSYDWRGNRVCVVDLHEMTKCISLIIGGTHDALTTAQGVFPHRE
jgi:hypothetical protein